MSEIKKLPIIIFLLLSMIGYGVFEAYSTQQMLSLSFMKEQIIEIRNQDDMKGFVRGRGIASISLEQLKVKILELIGMFIQVEKISVNNNTKYIVLRKQKQKNFLFKRPVHQKNKSSNVTTELKKQNKHTNNGNDNELNQDKSYVLWKIIKTDNKGKQLIYDQNFVDGSLDVKFEEIEYLSVSLDEKSPLDFTFSNIRLKGNTFDEEINGRDFTFYINKSSKDEVSITYLDGLKNTKLIYVSNDFLEANERAISSIPELDELPNQLEKVEVDKLLEDQSKYDEQFEEVSMDEAMKNALLLESA
jgi:hypothetical protein